MGMFAALVMMGCSEPSQRLNAPPQGDSAYRADLQAPFVYMTDNAAMLDSSIADIHFEPHVADLSGLGVRRLTRMGELLSHTGGVIRYETASQDAELIEARLGRVRDFLDSSGFDSTEITVEAGMARNGTTAATEAIEIKHRGTSSEDNTGSYDASGMSPTSSN
jgi:hypothetical protein